MRGKSELMNPKTCLRPTLLACALGLLLQAPAALAAPAKLLFQVSAEQGFVADHAEG